MPVVKNKVSYIGFSCDKGKKLASLQQFGLAYSNQTCTGSAYRKSVITTDRCTLGRMKDHQAESNLLTEFDKSCLGKSVCSMKLDYLQIFSDECTYEIERRNQGFSPYGPPKVYAIAACRKDFVSVPQLSNEPYSQESIAMVIVLVDLLMMWMLSIFIIRLRWYEKISVQDIK